MKVDFSKVMERMRRIRAEISNVDSAEHLSSLGIDVFVGKGVFVSANSIRVNDKDIHFRKVSILWVQCHHSALIYYSLWCVVHNLRWWKSLRAKYSRDF